MFPSNESETIALYQLAQDDFGWHISHLQAAFPDAVIENRGGKQLVVEFEYLAKNFRRHKHDPGGCDLIICWRNDWADAPLPVWALGEIPSCARRAQIIEKGLKLRLSTLVRIWCGKVAEAETGVELWQSRHEKELQAGMAKGLDLKSAETKISHLWELALTGVAMTLLWGSIAIMLLLD